MRWLVLFAYIVLCPAAHADGFRDRTTFECKPTFENIGIKEKTTKIELALEHISPNGRERWLLQQFHTNGRWQLQQFHAYHTFDNGMRFDYSYWLFNRVLLLLYYDNNVPLNMWRGQLALNEKSTYDATTHREEYGVLVHRENHTWFYMEGEGDPEKGATTLKSECTLLFNSDVEPDK